MLDVVKVVSGIAIGAVAGILLAPDKGSKTRYKIKSTALDTKDTLVDKASEMSDEIALKFNSQRSEFEGQLDEMLADSNQKADDMILSLERKLTKLRKENELISAN